MLCSRVMGLLFSSLGISFALVSLASDFWVVNSHVLFHAGLWRLCIKGNCGDILSGTEYIDATRAFMILTVVTSFLAIFSACASFASHLSAKRYGSMGASISTICSAVFLTIAMAVYTAKTAEIQHVDTLYGWSFFLGWVAFPSFCIAALCHFLAFRSSPAPGYQNI
ncbi:protein NKG7-like [Ambystoma mexicanum]|uniref:protein NKG7-like n=1 Tax=Ambystoma mexicanum TaxID=8296 RepID=UPI0037E89B5E